LLSQDLLGNMTASAGYSWRGYHSLHAGLTYKGWYPVMELNVEYGGDRGVYGKDEQTLQPKSPNVKIGANAYIPFNFTRNRYITGLTPQVQLNYTTSYFYSPSAGNYRYGLLESVYGISFHRYLKSSIRDLAPRWGIVLQTALKHIPDNIRSFGYMYYVFGRVYLPGIARHHSLQLSGGWQEQKPKEYLFGSMLAFPRGYINGQTEKLRIGLAEYSFPFLYPDRNLSFLVYLKRLSANLFCHAAENRYRVYNRQSYRWQSDQLLSIGADILADVNFLRSYFPVNIGLRTVYVPETKEIQPHLLFKISFD
jgi:hypothetical protein